MCVLCGSFFDLSRSHAWSVVVGRDLEEFVVEVCDVFCVWGVSWHSLVGRVQVGCMSIAFVFYVCWHGFVVWVVKWLV